MIFRNKHPAGSVYNILFGLCEIADGAIRVITFGMYCSTWVIDCARHSAKVAIDRMKEKRGEAA